MTEPHAVRWAVRYSPAPWSDDGAIWTKWHWTENANNTLCGLPIIIGRDNAPLFPQTDDRQEQVTCKRCKRKLQEATND